MLVLLVFICGHWGQVSVWTVLVLGPPSLCLGVGEASAALLAGSARKALEYSHRGLINAPRGTPSPWRWRLIDGCHGAEGQIGKRKGEWHCGICPASTTAEKLREYTRERGLGGWGGGR